MHRERNDTSLSLHVSGFKDNVRPSDLANLFEPHGRLSDVYIPRDYYSGNRRGFAYVQYHNEDDARRVYESGEEFVLDGRKLHIQYAQGRRKTPGQMRGQGRGGERRGRSRSAERHYRPNRRYSRSRSHSRSRSAGRRRRDSRSPVRRGRSRSRTPPRRRSPSPRRRRSVTPKRHSRSRSRSRSPRGRSVSRERRSRSRSRSPRRRYTPSPDRDSNKVGNGSNEPMEISSSAAGLGMEQGEMMEQGQVEDN